MLSEPRPFLLLRARPKAPERGRFEEWFRDSHIPAVRRIPGISGVEVGRTAGGTTLGIYMFESAEVVQAALSSPEAAYARGTWDAWTPHLDELLIEMWAPLVPLAIYQSAG
ncbi:MAG: hypothetical protein HY875_01755 [Chloroflexi bacterium]|nr:hypothetical protein [Chloroflexota bacterium]